MNVDSKVSHISRRDMLAGSLAVSSLTALADIGGLLEHARAAAAPPPHTTGGPDIRFPERIRYDGQCLTIDGQELWARSGKFLPERRLTIPTSGIPNSGITDIAVDLIED